MNLSVDNNSKNHINPGNSSNSGNPLNVVYPQANININNLNVIVNNNHDNGSGKLEISEVIRPIINDIYINKMKPMDPLVKILIIILILILIIKLIK